MWSCLIFCSDGPRPYLFLVSISSIISTTTLLANAVEVDPLWRHQIFHSQPFDRQAGIMKVVTTGSSLISASLVFDSLTILLFKNKACLMWLSPIKTPTQKFSMFLPMLKFVLWKLLEIADISAANSLATDSICLVIAWNQPNYSLLLC